MPTITTNEDGSYTITVPAPAAQVVAPEATEIDVILTDGSTKKFVPAV